MVSQNNIYSAMISYVEVPVYSRLDVVAGLSLYLLCNTSLTSDITWSYDTDDNDGYVDYVYMNGLVISHKPRLSVKVTADGFHSLVIADAELSDSGLYNCYDGEGRRKVGYQLIVNGMCYTVVYLCNSLFICDTCNYTCLSDTIFGLNNRKY